MYSFKLTRSTILTALVLGALFSGAGAQAAEPARPTGKAPGAQPAGQQRTGAPGGATQSKVSAGTPARAKTAPAAGKPEWVDISVAFQTAARSDRWLMVDVYTDWCGWCKRLDRDTYKNSNVEQFLAKSFVCAKANAEDNGPGQQLARQFHVGGYPTILILAPNGQLRGKIESYLAPTEFIDTVQKIVAAPAR
jgi:thiol:disulfide interchange protein